MPLLGTSVRFVVLLHLPRWCVVSWHRSVLIAFRPKRYEKKIWGVVFWRNHINGICFCWYHPLSCVTFLNFDTFFGGWLICVRWWTGHFQVSIMCFVVPVDGNGITNSCCIFRFFVVDGTPPWLCYGILSSTNIRWQIFFLEATCSATWRWYGGICSYSTGRTMI